MIIFGISKKMSKYLYKDVYFNDNGKAASHFPGMVTAGTQLRFDKSIKLISL